MRCCFIIRQLRFVGFIVLQCRDIRFCCAYARLQGGYIGLGRLAIHHGHKRLQICLRCFAGNIVLHGLQTGKSCIRRLRVGGFQVIGERGSQFFRRNAAAALNLNVAATQKALPVYRLDIGA